MGHSKLIQRTFSANPRKRPICSSGSGGSPLSAPGLASFVQFPGLPQVSIKLFVFLGRGKAGGGEERKAFVALGERV